MPSRSAVVVRNLPRQTTEVDVKRFFDTRLRDSDAIVFPLLQDTQHGAGTHLCTTVTLKSSWRKRALKLNSKEFIPAQGQEKSEIQIDATNIGPITLAEHRSPQFDAYFVHGIEGDAFTSWVCDETGHMWPRDSFPQHCLNLGVRGRFSTLGYDSKVLNSKEPRTVQSAAESLLTYIRVDRPEGCQRPIFLICHSYGGIAIAQALILAFAKPAVKEEYQFIQHMVHGVAFFGTPFQGSNNADWMSPVANLVGSLTNRPSSYLSELKTNSKTLPNLSMGYNRIMTEENIETLVFVEKRDNGPSRVTTRESAILPFDTVIAPIEIDANHVNMVKFASATEARLPATAIANMIKRKLGLPPLPTSPQQPAIPDLSVLSIPGLDHTGVNNDENAGFSQLSQFDTVFVVDDTGSMQLQANSDETYTPQTKSRWDVLTRALQYIANIATEYDSDGLDIHFLISTKLNRKNVRSGEEILSLLKQVDLAKSVGGTFMNPPLAEILGPHLIKYKQHFERKVANQETVPPKPLNIIVLTDGKADDEKVLKRLLVRTAKHLDEMYAPDSQIGIQFLQVGDDKDAAAFLKRLDDELEEKYDTRDFIDTKTFTDQDENTDFTQRLREILLGAVNRSLD